MGMGRNLGSVLLFVFLIHFFWFFGIHGNHLLENVAQTLFVPGVTVNIALIAGGNLPTEIVSKAFLDTFVFLGGSGTSLCLVIALLLFEKRRSVRGLAGAAASQVIFNINELMMFGLPVVFNPLMLIPFIMTPLVLTLTAYFATAWGIIPYVVNPVEWTTPIILSGYTATGSIAGSLFQLFNVALGVAIYAPFVILSQRQYNASVSHHIQQLTQMVKNCEAKGVCPEFGSIGGKLGAVSKMLMAEFKTDLQNQRLELFYQPQVNYQGEIVGLEALLRWKHRIAGYLYPPLVVAIAEECGLLDEMGDYITEKACSDMEKLNELFDFPICVSVNFSAKQMSDPKLSERLGAILSRHDLGWMKLGVEITEQSALASSDIVCIQLGALKDLGTAVIMDDFGMGHSSMVYLQNNRFDEVKLDGALVRELLENQRCSDIISSIVYLSQSLGFSVLAEYVETAEQRELLHALGCDIYQGWLYSPAVPFDQAVEYIRKTLETMEARSVG